MNRQLPIFRFDENYLRELERKFRDKREKAANIVFTLNKYVIVEHHRNPVYESIADRVEKILKMWREKKKDYERIYEEGVVIVNEIQELRERQGLLGFSDMQYSMLLILENALGRREDLINKIYFKLFSGYCGFKYGGCKGYSPDKPYVCEERMCRRWGSGYIT